MPRLLCLGWPPFVSMTEQNRHRNQVESAVQAVSDDHAVGPEAEQTGGVGGVDWLAARHI
jgi:hypothetical protein